MCLTLINNNGHDCATLESLCNSSDLDLNKYFQASKLIELQEKRNKKD